MRRILHWPLVIVAAPFIVTALAAVVYFGALWTVHDLDPDFLSIDSCLDGGGVWDQAGQRCIRG